MSVRFLSLPIDEVSMRLIRPSAIPIRNDAGDIQGLCKSIQEVGLLQPIIIRNVDGYFEVVAGSRRLEACRRLRWRTVPCHVVELSDKEAFEIALTENLQRETMDPMEEAAAFKKYVEQSGWGGASELSRRTGRSPAYISKRIRLLSIPTDVLAKIFRRRKIMSIGEEVLSLETSEQLEVARTLEQGTLSIRELRKLVKTIKDARPIVTPSEPFVPALRLSAQSEKEKLVVRCIDQIIAALRLALSRMDDVLDKMEKQWVEEEILRQYRTSLHSQIDSLIRLRKKLAFALAEKT